MNEHNSPHEVEFLSNGWTVDRRHNMFEVTQAVVVIKARFSLDEKLSGHLVQLQGLLTLSFR